MYIDCDGQVVTDTNGVPACLDMGGSPLAWQTAPVFEIAELDPSMMSAAFAAGFVIVATCWAIGKGARTVLSMIGR